MAEGQKLKFAFIQGDTGVKELLLDEVRNHTKWGCRNNPFSKPFFSPQALPWPLSGFVLSCTAFPELSSWE